MSLSLRHHPIQTPCGENDGYPDSILLESRCPDELDAKPKVSLSADVIVYLTISALVLLVWQINKMGLFEAGDDIGYWLGVAGGVMMLLLLSYPLRKHFRFTRNWGRVKWWFLAHMVLGVGGPVLILLHSTFRVGSLNAAVALYSMITVALSGVVGRFLYARVNRGLHSEQVNLRDLQERAGLQRDDARSRLSFAPRVEAHLMAFEEREINAQANGLTYIRQVFWLPVQQWKAYRDCAGELQRVLSQRAAREKWLAEDYSRRQKNAQKLVTSYLTAVTRVAQYQAYARLFSLWHVAHIPLLYLLAISAVVHVVAVHAY
jgi:hypothetical protein